MLLFVVVGGGTVCQSLTYPSLPLLYFDFINSLWGGIPQIAVSQYPPIDFLFMNSLRGGIWATKVVSHNKKIRLDL